MVGDNFTTDEAYLVNCDDDLDGISTFNLEDTIPQITGNTVGAVSITFFVTLEDAQANVNALTNTESYNNTVPELQIMYGRAEHVGGWQHGRVVFTRIRQHCPVNAW